MPLNCPILLGENRTCTQCRHYGDKLCHYWTHEPVPINDILTLEERIELLEKPTPEPTIKQPEIPKPTKKSKPPF